MKKFIPTIITLGSAASGMLAVWSCLAQRPEFAAPLLILSVILDGLDGTVARMTGTESEIGGDLDSLSDAIAFGVAPAFFALSQYPLNFPAVLAGTFFVLCGVYRLARFNTLPKSHVFLGMPITVNGLLFPLLFYFHSVQILYLTALVIMGILMVSRIRVPKIKW